MRILKISVLAAALAFAAGANAASFQLARGDADLVPTTLASAKKASAKVGSSETDATYFAWALEADAALSAAQPFRAESREFWTQVDAAKARSGWSFTPTADGALVRISLQGDAKARSLATADLLLRVDGKARDSASVIEHLAGDAELKAVGTRFSEGTMVFQLAPGLAGKRIEVALPKARSGALMHVLEPQSPFTMELAADHVQALAGNRVSFDVKFLDAGKPIRGTSVMGLVTAPDGRSFDLSFKLDKSGRATASFQLPADAGGGLEPWEIHAFGATKAARAEVLRDARTAVMVSLPTARLEGSADVSRVDGGLVFALPVQTAVEGRFELRGTLHGTDAQGVLRPMAIAHGANVLAAGSGQLELRFPANVLNPSLGAPYALRDLSLSDQSRLGLSEHRELALEIPALQ